MPDLVLALFLFLLFIAFHIMLNRLRMMALQPAHVLVLALLVFLISLPLQSGFGSIISAIFHIPRAVPGLDLPLPLSSRFLYFLLALWYAEECTILENQSPSMTIVEQILKKKGQRIDPLELRQIFTDTYVIEQRLKDLVSHGHVAFDGIRYHLSPRGRRLASFFKWYRDFLRLGIGG